MIFQKHQQHLKRVSLHIQYEEERPKQGKTSAPVRIITLRDTKNRRSDIDKVQTDDARQWSC